MYSLLFLAVVSFVLCLFLTPVVRNIFLRFGLVDHPDDPRKLHNRPIPRVGGIAIALGYTLAFGLLLVTKLKAGDIVWNAFPLIWKLFPAAVLIFVTGLLDDLFRLKPWQKLAGQIAAATVAYFAGVQVLGAGGGHFFAWWLSFPATVVWLVACCNAVNLLDGVDGLAAGVGFVATATTVLAAAMQHNVELLMATVPLAGCLLAFLRYNFNPATIFLGDCGSLFIGFLLGCDGVLWSQKSATILGMTAPLMALSIPLLDTLLAIVRRFLRHEPIFGADRNHIHHRLLERGFTPRRVALLLYGTGALAAIFSLSMASHHFEVPVILAFCIAAWLGIRHLGYVEFDTAGRMLLQGSFRSLLNSHITLKGLECKLSAANTPEECWAIVRNAYRDFGFHQVRLQLGGCCFAENAGKHNPMRVWKLEIPLSDNDYVHLIRESDSAAKHNTIAVFADVLRKALEEKIPTFTSRAIPALDIQPLDPLPAQYQTVAAGN
jgi:UDP-GlcNAc:undecaprenyl-phosphate/decaprenyl-phosphate GlcNAc-1-phosphate transferase